MNDQYSIFLQSLRKYFVNLRVFCQHLYQRLYFMNNQNSKPSIKQKIANYFKFFCGTNQDVIETKIKQTQKTKRRTSLKNKRISFILDRALVKLSRKNLCAEEFSSPSLTKELLQIHIASRLNSDSFVIFQGKFSDKIMKNSLLSFKLIDSMPSAFSKNNQILVMPYQNFRLRNRMAQILVRQIQTRMIEQIQLTLKQFHGIISTYIFILYQGLEVAKLHELFIVFKDLYLFEVQRVMVLQKCYANIIYISRFKQILMIDENVLVQFYMDELIRKDSHIERVDFPFMLLQLVKTNLCIQVSSTIGEIMASQKQIQSYDKEFIYLMHQRYPKSHPFIDKYLNTLKEDHKSVYQINNKVPQFYENTPLFGEKKECNRESEKQEKEVDQRQQSQQPKRSYLSFGMRLGLFD